MPSTTRRSLPYPALTDTADVPRDLAALAGALDNVAVDLPQGTLANRPAPGSAGRFYWATDVGLLSRDNGTQWITVGPVADGSISTAKLADGAVTGVKLGDASVSTAKLAGEAVTEGKLASGSVVTSKIGDGQVTTAKLADNAVTNGKLADNAVTSAKIAAGNIGTSHIADGQVTSAKIADGAIATVDLGDGIVTSAKIADGTIARTDLAGALSPGQGGGTATEADYAVRRLGILQGDAAAGDRVSAALGARSAALSGGGVLTTTTNSPTGVGVKWTGRFILISAATGSSAGYVEAYPPAVGSVIQGENGGTSRTVQASGFIPLGAWEVLYAVIPTMAHNGPALQAQGVEYRIGGYGTGTGDDYPPNWLPLAAYNSDHATVRWATGRIMALNQTWNPTASVPVDSIGNAELAPNSVTRDNLGELIENSWLRADTAMPTRIGGILRANEGMAATYPYSGGRLSEAFQMPGQHHEAVGGHLPMRTRFLRTIDAQSRASGYTRFSLFTLSKDNANWDSHAPVEVIVRTTYTGVISGYGRFLIFGGYQHPFSVLPLETAGNVPIPVVSPNGSGTSGAVTTTYCLLGVPAYAGVHVQVNYFHPEEGAPGAQVFPLQGFPRISFGGVEDAPGGNGATHEGGVGELVRGSFRSDGLNLGGGSGGPGWNCVRQAVGQYYVSFTRPFQSTCVPVATVGGGDASDRVAKVASVSPNGFQVFTSLNNTAQDNFVNFLAVSGGQFTGTY